MGTMASQISIVYPTVYSRVDQQKHESSKSLAFVREIRRWPVNSSHKWPVTRKMFPFEDIMMINRMAEFRPSVQLTISLNPGRWQ